MTRTMITWELGHILDCDKMGNLFSRSSLVCLYDVLIAPVAVLRFIITFPDRRSCLSVNLLRYKQWRTKIIVMGVEMPRYRSTDTFADIRDFHTCGYRPRSVKSAFRVARLLSGSPTVRESYGLGGLWSARPTPRPPARFLSGG